MTGPNKKRVLLALSGFAALAATPALAADPASKPIEVSVSAKVFATPASKLCMPKENVGKKRDKALPGTMCHTREEWEAMGVVFKVR